MVTHRFTVNVPNPEPKPVTARLHLARVTPNALRALALDVPITDLKVLDAGITLDPCASKGERDLQLRLAPFSSADVHVVITTAPVDPRRGGTTAFNLVDERGGNVVGGVLLACADRVIPEGPGQVVNTPRPCPVVLAKAPYPIAIGGDPTTPPANATFPQGQALELVAQITNPRKVRLQDVQVYLEHLGTSDASFVPATWNVGTLDPGAVFYATWSVFTSGVLTGAFRASIVVSSQSTDATRLSGELEIGRKRVDARPPRAATRAKSTATRRGKNARR